GDLQAGRLLPQAGGAEAGGGGEGRGPAPRPRVAQGPDPALEGPRPEGLPDAVDRQPGHPRGDGAAPPGVAVGGALSRALRHLGPPWGPGDDADRLPGPGGAPGGVGVLAGIRGAGG